MLIFIPHVFGESIYELAPFIREFENEELMKRFLMSKYNCHYNDISFDNQIYFDDRLGWEDIRRIFLTKDDKVYVLGGYATKYKSLETTLEKLIPSDKDTRDYLLRTLPNPKFQDVDDAMEYNIKILRKRL